MSDERSAFCKGMMSNRPRLTILICLVLAALTLAAYWQVLGHGFVAYDDDEYVFENEYVKSGLTLQSAKWAFTHFHSANWHPLTWISHMLDRSIYGMKPFGHHLTNVLIHILSALLLYLLLQRMTGCIWRSAFVAALFALHPLHVESVAWVSERKDVLSTLFWLLTMHAYVSYVRRPGRAWYAVSLLAFAFGLMSKPMLVTLPLILLVADYWPLRRLEGKSPDRAPVLTKLLLEKAPFFALSGASCVVTFLAQRHGGAVMGIDHASIGIRVANALVSYIAYLGKTLWPAKLAVIYPHPFDTIPTWQVIGSAVLLAAISVLTLRAARKLPYLAAGWLWYLITLVPVIGLVQVGGQAMADRYTYVPLIGVFTALTWLLAAPVGRLGRVGQTTLPAVVVCACAVGTWNQTAHWKDSLTLFTRAAAVTGPNHVAQTGIGLALNKQGKLEEAIAHLEASIRIRPSAKAYNGLGVVLVRMDKPIEAVAAYEKALELEPISAKTYSNLGFLLIDLGRLDEAVARFKTSIKQDPEAAAPHFGLGVVYTQKGQADAAERAFLDALRIDAKNSYANIELGDIALRRGDTDKAIEYFEAAARISPTPETHYRLGSMLAHQQRLDEAMEHYRSAVRLKPDYAEAHYDLAVALSASGQLDEAIEHYSEAVRIAPDYGKAHRNLAIALYFKGEYARAWDEVRLTRRHGVEIDPEFIKALAAEMPEPKR